jgi:hypothetical protein
MAMLSLSSFAAVHTVSNNPNSPGQYTSVQAAHDAAVAGDTLLIHASETSYGSLTVIKQLVIIGEGALPNKQLLYRTTLGTITLSFAAFPATGNSSGTKIYGLDLSGISVGYSSSASTSSIGSITLSRNRINQVSFNGSSCSGHVYFNNVINSMYSGGLLNCIISNNIIGICNMSTSIGNNNLVTNNIIKSGLSIRSAVISNNIFYNFASSASLSFSTEACTYSNNIFYAGVTVNESAVITGTNTGSGNFFNEDPQFVYPTLPDQLYSYSYTTPASAPFANFHLQATSPGIAAGTDGTDIGIYGGGYPWVDGSSDDSRYRYFPMPRQVPHMIEMNILNPTVPVGNAINVEFNAKVVE